MDLQLLWEIGALNDGIFTGGLIRPLY